MFDLAQIFICPYNVSMSPIQYQYLPGQTIIIKRKGWNDKSEPQSDCLWNCLVGRGEVSVGSM
jgi:hypothetical protein